MGLQLDWQYKIKRIWIAFPNSCKKEYYFLGILEGLNDATFIDVESLHMITKEIKNKNNL